MNLQEQDKPIKQSLEDCVNGSNKVINNIFEKYKNDDWMISKIDSYIVNQLPNVIDNIKITHEQRISRIEELTNEQDNFISTFLNDNQYFFISTTDRFFYYNGVHYQVISEDDILHNILTTITRGKNLMSWKQKTKIHIMKRIKETSLITTIPESITIQGVIDALYPTLFASRNEAKYFLTIIGDNIHRKNMNLVHYINSTSRQFIKELNQICQFLIGIGIGQTFKNKYHDHTYDDCRLININNTVRHEHVWNKIINNLPLDLICVASHYSIRYGSSDDFVNEYCNDDDLKDSVFYVKNMDPDKLVTTFVTDYLDINLSNKNMSIINETSDGLNRSTQITWRNMQYLWKHFLDTKNLPPIMFLNTFKTILLEKIGIYYTEEQDTFIGICSQYLPAIQQFLHFWGDTIVLDDNEDDFEIEEIVSLFKKWCNINNNRNVKLNDKQTIDLIQYFFPMIEIERDKYISGIRCQLWDKQLDIQTALDNMKETLRNNNDKSMTRVSSPNLNSSVSIYDAYTYYCKFHSSKNSLIVSKTYFEKYVFDNLDNYIIDNKFLSHEWYIL